MLGKEQAKWLWSLHYCPSAATMHNAHASCRRKAMRQDKKKPLQ